MRSASHPFLPRSSADVHQPMTGAALRALAGAACRAHTLVAAPPVLGAGGDSRQARRSTRVVPRAMPSNTTAPARGIAAFSVPPRRSGARLRLLGGDAPLANRLERSDTRSLSRRSSRCRSRNDDGLRRRQGREGAGRPDRIPEEGGRVAVVRFGVAAPADPVRARADVGWGEGARKRRTGFSSRASERFLEALLALQRVAPTDRPFAPGAPPHS